MRFTLQITSALTALLMATTMASCADAGPAKSVNKTEVEVIVYEYLMEHPEVIREALIKLQEKETQREIDDTKLSIATLSKEIRHDSRDYSIGPADAKVTLVEFFDYNCSYCKKSTAWIQALIEKHPNDVRIVFKELPILEGRTRTSRNAAIAALAAHKQGKYLEMHMALMNGTRLTDAFINSKAKKMGLDMEKFAADRNDEALQGQLENVLTLASGIPLLTGTPFFIMNDQFLGSGNTDRLQAMLDEELAK